MKYNKNNMVSCRERGRKVKGYYLAVDIGASSGRHMLAHMEDGRLCLEEVYRFQNGMKEIDGALCWDFDRLFSEIKQGMRRCGELGKVPVSMGVDTWGVDFVLLDKEDRVLGPCVGYRDREREGWTRRWRRSSRRRCSINGPAYKSRSTTPSTSSRQSKRSIRSI